MSILVHRHHASHGPLQPCLRYVCPLKINVYYRISLQSKASLRLHLSLVHKHLLAAMHPNIRKGCTRTLQRRYMYVGSFHMLMHEINFHAKVCLRDLTRWKLETCNETNVRVPYWATPPPCGGLEGGWWVPAQGSSPPQAKRWRGGRGKSFMSGQCKCAHQQEWPGMSFFKPKLALPIRRRDHGAYRNFWWTPGTMEPKASKASMAPTVPTRISGGPPELRQLRRLRRLWHLGRLQEFFGDPRNYGT